MERMKSETIVHGRIIKKYKLSKDEIDDLNRKYENAKKGLNSYSPRLAGRIKSELEFTNILESTTAFSTIADYISNYINSSQNFHLLAPGPHHIKILSCWVNDMVEGEYNPPHTHHDLSGWSTVLFLKIPTFVQKPKALHKHKFKDGQLGLINVNGIGTTWLIPEVGDFYIFEARHQHCVMPFKTINKNEVRRSMSFNFITKKEKE